MAVAARESRRRWGALGVGAALTVALMGCAAPTQTSQGPPASTTVDTAPARMTFEHGATPDAQQLAQAAASQVGQTVLYDPAYVQLDYPGGDVAIERGVCTDVVVRAFRELGVDLQVEVHKDMTKHFDKYPRRWGLSAPDSNIDHRRVPNLQTFFRRSGKSLSVSNDGAEYWPGDVVTWDVGGRPHIGIVSVIPGPGGERYQIVHNIGAGTQVEDRLFDYEITGHFRPF